MSGVRLELDFSDGAIGAALRRAEQAGADLHAPLTASGEQISSTIRDRFATGTGPGGIRWIPSQRAPRGVEKRQGKAAPDAHQTLIDTGALLESIKFEVRDKEVEAGSAANAQGAVDKYAATHQFGATIRAKNAPYLVFIGADGGFHSVKEVTIPARPYVGFDDQDVTDLTDLWRGFAEDAFGR